jgi:hypothetical protein
MITLIPTIYWLPTLNHQLNNLLTTYILFNCQPSTNNLPSNLSSTYTTHSPITYKLLSSYWSPTIPPTHNLTTIHQSLTNYCPAIDQSPTIPPTHNLPTIHQSLTNYCPAIIITHYPSHPQLTNHSPITYKLNQLSSRYWLPTIPPRAPTNLSTTTYNATICIQLLITHKVQYPSHQPPITYKLSSRLITHSRDAIHLVSWIHPSTTIITQPPSSHMQLIIHYLLTTN